MKRQFIFLKYVSFNMLSMIGLSCYILADTLFIANGVGSMGLAALNLIIPLYNVITGIGLLIGVGSATHFSILKVQNKAKEASLYFSIAMKLALMISIPIAVMGFLFAENIMHFMGANQEIIPIASAYLKAYIIFTPFFILQQIVVAFIRNDNNPRLASIAMLLGTLFNIVFDYILVFPCQLGMVGAALATGFSPIITLLICSLHVLWKQNYFHYLPCQINKNKVYQIISVGIPSFITELSGGIIVFVFNMVILSIGGNIAVASYGIISNLALVVTSLYTGIAQGVQPLLSQSHGQKNTSLMSAYLRYSLMTSFIVSMLVYSCIMLFPQWIISIFNSENNFMMMSIAIQGLPLYFFGFFFAGINMIFVSYFASVQKFKPSFFISLLRGGLIVIPLVMILSILFSLTGVWLSFPISECLITLMCLILYRKKERA